MLCAPDYARKFTQPWVPFRPYTTKSRNLAPFSPDIPEQRGPRVEARRLLLSHLDRMLYPMSAPRTVALVALLVAGLATSPAAAQATWEDAPLEGGAEPEADAPAELQTYAPQSAPAAPQSYEDTDPRALSDFNTTLAPYGRWRDDPTYGRVWVPHPKAVGPDFAPYVTNGHWALADDGEWMWVSNYPFGWVVFHYGRWVWIRGVGWSWIPGREYAHAWVVWRTPGPGVYYVGWAPMPPDYIWVNGYAVGVGFGLYTTWVFCPSAYVYSHHMHHYIVRDHHHVHYLGTHTHRYRPPHGKAAYSGPSPKVARIPAKAVPVKRTAANPKAVAASRPTPGSAAMRSPPVSRSGFTRPPAGARPLPPGQSKSLGATTTPSARPAPVARPVGPAPSRAAPPQPSRGYTPPPSRPAPSYSRPAPAPRQAAPSRVQPSQPSSPPRASSPPPRAAPAPPPVRSPAPSRGAAPSRRR